MEQPPELLPPSPPQSLRRGSLGRAWAVAGIVAGLLFFILPGVLALRSYRRWRAGSINAPTFAWICALIGVPLIAVGAFSTWALYNVPVLEDDFSDPASGWRVRTGPDWSVGYHEGTYRIELRSSDLQATFLTWNEGPLPNVAVEADILLLSGDESKSGAGVGCLASKGVGYLFLIGADDTFSIFRSDKNGITIIAHGDLPPTVQVSGSNNRVRGECRAGFGVPRLTMYVNGTKLEETREADEGAYVAFSSIMLGVASTAEATTDARFDNALVIGIQPS